MTGYLSGRRVGFVVAQTGVEEDELVGPRAALDQAGADTVLIAPESGDITTMRDGTPCAMHRVEQTLATTSADRFDALVLPDGEANSLALRREPRVVDLLTSFAGGDQPIGAFGYAVWSLLDAELVPGRQVTGHPSLRQEVEKVGGRWHDRRVVVDANLITSRASQDVDAFTLQLVAFLDR